MFRRWLARWLGDREVSFPEHLRRGQRGEEAARRHLQGLGWKFLAANVRFHRPGEIDLVFRDAGCLVFVEVKTRTAGGLVRPAAAVNRAKRRNLSRVALDYVRRLPGPAVRMRFDIVEVLLVDGEISEVRHLPNAFPLAAPYRYGP